ncbi:hypothetical protein GLYMA_05G234550v4 [Glycine max]|nr:hypothetical protein GLYMA_05G234550v4 [Glycine max]
MRGIVVLLVVFGVACSKKGQEVLFTSLRCFFCHYGFKLDL